MWFNLSRTRSQISYNLIKRSFAQFFSNRIAHSNYVSQKNDMHRMAVSKLSSGYSINMQGLKYFSTDGYTSSLVNMAQKTRVQSPVQSPVHVSPWLIFADWAKWILGSAFSLLLPAVWKLNCEKLKKIEGEAELVMEELESAADEVEKLANAAEKITAKVADTIPGDNKLKETAMVVHRVSKLAAHEAQITKNIIHQVEELKHDAGGIEAIIARIIHKTGKPDADN